MLHYRTIKKKRQLEEFRRQDDKDMYFLVFVFDRLVDDVSTESDMPFSGR